jgi:hypothetical protein
MSGLIGGSGLYLTTGAGARLVALGAGVPPPVPLAPTQLAADGGWCWFADPRAICHNGKTYFGYIDRSGNVKVRTFTHATGEVSAAVTLHAALEVDDHDNPTLLMRDSDKRLLVFYSRHLGSTIYKRVSTNPEDASAWGPEVSLGGALGGSQYTYPSPLYTSADSRLYLFYRNHISGNASWRYNVSHDGGETWGSSGTTLHPLIYSKIESNGVDRVDVACSNHPRGGADICKIRHLYRHDDAWRRSDGTVLSGTPPFAADDLTLVYDGGDKPVWIWDIAYDGSGNPVVVFAKFESTSDHRYWYGRWTGAGWDCHEICAAGGSIHVGNYPSGVPQEQYSGGIVLDHADPSRVYCSRQVAGQWEIYRYVTADGGSTWAETAITSGSTVKQVRPVVVRGHADGLEVLWLSGRYTTYVDYDLATMGFAP